MAINDSVYLEQMALTTGYQFATLCDEIADAARDMGRPENRDSIRHRFKNYILFEDKSKFTVPTMEVYRPLQKLRVDFGNT